MGLIEIGGKYTSAIIYTVDDETAIDQHALAQVQMLCDSEACAGSRIRVMPDVHAGKVGSIGLTMTVGDKVMPALVGNDIGCGVTATRIRAKGALDFFKLDKVVREACGNGPRRKEGSRFEEDVRRCAGFLLCREHVQVERAVHAIGTLGGGNHFVELDRGSDGSLYLVVHSGSRILGQQVYDHYMREGHRALKRAGEADAVPYETTWLEGDLLAAYGEDMSTTCSYAEINREAMVSGICKGMKWKRDETLVIPHNYIDELGVLRKGAISASKGEPVLIPANMRDGIIMGIGKGNPDWNFSAPHGSGRVLKRSDVKAQHTVAEFKREMKRAWTSCIGAGTLDEAPFAYRGIDQIRDAIGETVEVADVLKPLYVFKNGGEG